MCLDWGALCSVQLVSTWDEMKLTITNFVLGGARHLEMNLYSCRNIQPVCWDLCRFASCLIIDRVALCSVQL